MSPHCIRKGIVPKDSFWLILKIELFLIRLPLDTYVVVSYLSFLLIICSLNLSLLQIMCLLVKLFSFFPHMLAHL